MLGKLLFSEPVWYKILGLVFNLDVTGVVATFYTLGMSESIQVLFSWFFCYLALPVVCKLSFVLIVCSCSSLTKSFDHCIGPIYEKRENNIVGVMLSIS